LGKDRTFCTKKKEQKEIEILQELDREKTCSIRLIQLTPEAVRREENS
jgi:hypothetical protein